MMPSLNSAHSSKRCFSPSSSKRRSSSCRGKRKYKNEMMQSKMTVPLENFFMFFKKRLQQIVHALWCSLRLPPLLGKVIASRLPLIEVQGVLHHLPQPREDERLNLPSRSISFIVTKTQTLLEKNRHSTW